MSSRRKPVCVISPASGGGSSSPTPRAAASPRRTAGRRKVAAKASSAPREATSFSSMAPTSHLPRPFGSQLAKSSADAVASSGIAGTLAARPVQSMGSSAAAAGDGSAGSAAAGSSAAGAAAASSAAAAGSSAGAGSAAGAASAAASSAIFRSVTLMPGRNMPAGAGRFVVHHPPPDTHTAQRNATRTLILMWHQEAGAHLVSIDEVIVSSGFRQRSRPSWMHRRFPLAPRV